MIEKPFCPVCDTPRITPRTGKYGGGRHWYCTECKRKIEEPTYREKQTEPALSGLPRRLEELDPEEVFG
jgi:ribosomal protein L37AE/L43A